MASSGSSRSGGGSVGGGSGGGCSASGVTLSSINEGDEHVSLMDVLCSRDAWLSEEELWAVCRECCVAILTLSASSETFQTYCVTPDTLAFDMSGAVCLLDFEVDDLLCKPPEFYSVGNSYKGHVYSLGTTMLMAAHYNMEGRKPHHSRRLTQLLAAMTDQDYDRRGDLEFVLRECDAHMRGRASRDICQRLAATVTCWRLKGETSSHDQRLTCRSPGTSRVTPGNERKCVADVDRDGQVALTTKLRHTTAAADRNGRTGRGAPSPSSMGGEGSASVTGYSGNCEGKDPEEHCPTACELLRPPAFDRRLPTASNGNVTKSTGDLSDRLAANRHLEEVSLCTSMIMLPTAIVNLAPHSRRPSAFTPRRELAAASAFTPFRPQAVAGDISVRVYGHENGATSANGGVAEPPQQPPPPPLRFRSPPAAYNSSATHFTPILLKSERKLFERFGEAKDRDAAKKIKELKKNLLRNLQPPVAPEAAVGPPPSTRRSADLADSVAVSAVSELDRARKASVQAPVTDGAGSTTIAHGLMHAMETTGCAAHSETNPSSPQLRVLSAAGYTDGPAMSAPEPEPVLLPPRRRAGSTRESVVSPERPVPIKRSLAAATLSRDSTSEVSSSSEPLKLTVCGAVAAYEAGDRFSRREADEIVIQKLDASSGRATDGKPDIPKRPRKRQSNVSGLTSQQVVNSTNGNATLNDIHTSDDTVATSASQPLSGVDVATVEIDCRAATVSSGDRGAAATMPAVARLDARAPSLPPSPSLSKDSGVGGLGYVGGGDPVLMDKLFTSEDGLRTRAILGRVLCLLRDEFSYDGFMENGIEDLAMAEYVSSLGGLSWSTFVSAVSEKYCDLYWQEELLARMYESINGKAPPVTRRPPTVAQTAHVIRVDEPKTPSAHESELISGTSAASLPHIQSPFRPISSALGVSNVDPASLSRTAIEVTSRVGQESAHFQVTAINMQPGTSNRGSISADSSRSHSTIGKPPSRQPAPLSKKRSASVQELINPSESNSQPSLGNGGLSLSAERLAIGSRTENGTHHGGRHLSLVTPNQAPSLSRCGSACSNGVTPGTTVIRVRGQLSDTSLSPHSDLKPASGRPRASDAGGAAAVLNGFTFTRTPSTSSASSGPSLASRMLAPRPASVSEVRRSFNEASTDDAEQQKNSRHLQNGHGLSARSQSRCSFGVVKEDKDVLPEDGGGLIDVIFYATSLQHMSSVSVLASSRLAESTERRDLLKQLGSAEQQIALQTKQRSKALKYCRQLQALTCGEGGRRGGNDRVLGERRRKAFDSRAVLEKAIHDVADANEKLHVFASTKKHIEMLLAERCGLELGVACSLAVANQNSPLALPVSPVTPDQSLLLFHETRDPRRQTDRTINSLHAGSASGLCCLLYARNSIVDQYIHHFLICYRYFISPYQLLEFITDKYSVSLMPMTQAAEINDNILPAHAVSHMEIPERVQTRSLDLLQVWVEGFFSVDFKYDGNLYSLLATFYESQVSRHHPARAEAGLRLLHDLERGLRSDLSGFSDTAKDNAFFIYAAAECGVAPFKKMLHRLNVVHGKSGKDSVQYVVASGGMLSLTPTVTSASPQLGEPHLVYSHSMDSFSLDDYTVQSLSEQLTLVEQKYYDFCHPVFFMNSRAQGIGASTTNVAYLSSKEDGSHFGSGQQQELTGNATSLFVSSYTQDAIIQYMLERAKRVAHWVAAELVSCSSAKSQLALLKKFIGIARVCKEIGNYATCVAITDGLENVIVRQLPVWRDVSYRHMEQLTGVKLFLKSDPMCLTAAPMATATTSAGQRLDASCTGVAAVTTPIIPSILTFVTHVQQAELGSFTLANGMLKWNKLRMLARIVDQLRIFKQKRYLFDADGPLCERLEARMQHMRLQDLDVLAAGQEVNFQRPRSASKWMRPYGKQQRQQQQQQQQLQVVRRES